MAENFRIIKKLREGNQATVEVEIPPTFFSEQEEKEIERAVQRVNIPGFRKGKAPREVVLRQLDGAALREQVIENIAQKIYPLLIQEAALEPVDSPNVEITKQSDAGPIGLTFTVTVSPEVKLGKYKGLKATRPLVEVHPDEVERVLKDLQESLAKWNRIPDRGAERGDVAVFDFTTSHNGSVVPALTGKNARIEVGQSRLPSSFDEGLTAMRPGEEKEIQFSCPPDFWIAELSGKDVISKVRLRELYSKKLPSLDDEFCKLYLKKETLTEARRDIVRRLEESKQKAADSHCREELIQALIQETEVEIPPVMVNREVETMLREMNENLKQEGVDVETYLKRTRKSMEELRSELRRTAESRVKSKVALRRVAASEKLTVTEEDMNAEWERLAQQEQKNLQTFRQEFGEGGQSYIRDYLLRHKALDFLVSKAKIETVREENRERTPEKIAVK